MSKFDLSGRVAVITGGGTGIGRGAALVLAEHGADVVPAGRRPEPLESAVKEIRALGRRALAVPTDVTDPDRCQDLVDTTLNGLGRLDILVNCAGGAETKSLAKWTEDEWHQVVALNLGEDPVERDAAFEAGEGPWHPEAGTAPRVVSPARRTGGCRPWRGRGCRNSRRTGR